ncbi:MAG TPA: hypothetical protein VL135_00860 [Terracidiphilus sp.]|jgi:hypothetical protein|nr:hypothetical protein [Terracidiphilus sp.]
MRSKNWRSAPAFVALVLAIASVPAAFAQCGMPTRLIKPSAFHPAVHGAVPRASTLNNDLGVGQSIVGMWHVLFTAQTMNGSPIPDTVIDNALSVWHNDHTEIMNSVRPPQDGNFCLGVWQQTGKSSFYLNHFAWYGNQFPNDTNNGIGDPVGPTHFTETVTVAPDGNHFTGTFTLTAYDTQGHVTISFTGALSGTRITTTTTTEELF